MTSPGPPLNFFHTRCGPLVMGRGTPGIADNRAFYWPGSGNIQDLGTLREDGDGLSTARGPNDLGDIVGSASNESNLEEHYNRIWCSKARGEGGKGGGEITVLRAVRAFF